MINIYHLLIASVLAIVLLRYIFPKVIYVLCEAILILGEVIDYSEDKKEDFANCLITRLFYLSVFLIAWGMMIVLFVLMQILSYIEVFGGFVDKKLLELED